MKGINMCKEWSWYLVNIILMMMVVIMMVVMAVPISRGRTRSLPSPRWHVLIELSSLSVHGGCTSLSMRTISPRDLEQMGPW